MVAIPVALMMLLSVRTIRMHTVPMNVSNVFDSPLPAFFFLEGKMGVVLCDTSAFYAVAPSAMTPTPSPRQCADVHARILHG